MIIRCISFLRRHYGLVQKAFLLVLVLLVLGDLAVPRHHPHFLGDKVPGFWSVFGFLSCAIIIIGSKWLGHAWLFRPEDYYDKEGNE